MYLTQQTPAPPPVVLGDTTSPELGTGVSFSPGFFLVLALGAFAIWNVAQTGKHYISHRRAQKEKASS